MRYGSGTQIDYPEEETVGSKPPGLASPAYGTIKMTALCTRCGRMIKKRGSDRWVHGESGARECEIPLSRRGQDLAAQLVEPGVWDGATA